MSPLNPEVAMVAAIFAAIVAAIVALFKELGPYNV